MDSYEEYLTKRKYWISIIDATLSSDVSEIQKHTLIEMLKTNKIIKEDPVMYLMENWIIGQPILKKMLDDGYQMDSEYDYLSTLIIRAFDSNSENVLQNHPRMYHDIFGLIDLLLEYYPINKEKGRPYLSLCLYFYNATKYDRSPIMKYLLSKGADPHKKFNGQSFYAYVFFFQDQLPEVWQASEEIIKN